MKNRTAFPPILGGLGLSFACGSGNRTSPGGKTPRAGASGGGADAGSSGAGASGGGADSGGSTGDGWLTPTACEPMTSEGEPIRVSLDGDAIAAKNVNGLTFKGFGVLSANGTSELLMDYKSDTPNATPRCWRSCSAARAPS
ncbi:MAG: hypothetical protein QM784_22880 [Polyangiaceae bacterium]